MTSNLLPTVILVGMSLVIHDGKIHIGLSVKNPRLPVEFIFLKLAAVQRSSVA